MTIDARTAPQHMADATEWADRIRRRDLSSQELTYFYLGRIALHNDQLAAYITVCEEAALRAAAKADEEMARGQVRGPLHGVPIGLKDLIDTQDVLTTAGSGMWRERIPDEDAAAVRRLKSAGAIVLGKHNLHEFAYGTTNENEHFGTVRNPWDLTRTAGGSSGGSAAAIAADLCPCTLGTDTGGSIRIPAAFTGVYGLKPTYGRVSLRGVTPLAASLDHVGPLARSVRDVALLFHLISGFDPDDPHSLEAPLGIPSGPLLALNSRPLRGLRVGVPDGYFTAGAEDDVLMGRHRAITELEDLGAVMVPLQVPLIDEVAGWQATIIATEAFMQHQARLDSPDFRFGDAVRARLESGRAITGAEYTRAQEGRLRFRRELERLFTGSARRSGVASALAWGSGDMKGSASVVRSEQNGTRVDLLLTPVVKYLPPVLAQETVDVAGETVV
ncbi:MAG: amidase, partial [Firmicutes bacterium]|nr:amidase [Bacillota bacterium]